MQAFKKKDPYIKSTRYEVVKPTFNGNLQLLNLISKINLDTSQVYSFERFIC